MQPTPQDLQHVSTEANHSKVNNEMQVYKPCYGKNGEKSQLLQKCHIVLYGKISQTEKSCSIKYLTLIVTSEGITDREIAWRRRKWHSGYVLVQPEI